ncbi:MAG TPA: SpoIIE family protein phosphatase [Candidatus Brocadiia bacterium]|nr:SpoIIE family protein phosphatase [Candidatus Brocadiia bacterium]
MARLIAIAGPMAGREFEVGDRAIIGRATDCDIRLDDLTVSRRHASISRVGAGCVLEDLHSGNGVFVNQRRVIEPVQLADGDEIRLSRHTFKFILPPAKHTTSVTIQDRSAAHESSILGSVAVESTQTATLAAGQPPPATHQRLNTLLQISNALQSEFNLPKLLNLILDTLFNVFPQADRGFVMLSDDTGKLHTRAVRSRSEQTEEIAISRRIISEVTQRRMAILSADASDDSRFGGAMSIVNLQMRSMMCSPLIAQGQVLGVIHIDTVRQDERFTQDDLELLTGIACQTALAIANARMHERLMKRQRMERDLELAAQVQNSFLPAKAPEAPGWRFAACYQAALEVGGDFYDFIQPAEGRMIVAVGDVAGKGVPAALLMARMTSDVRFLCMQEPSPSRVLSRLNDQFHASSIEDVFVTLLLASIDLKTRLITFCNAAHCPALAWTAADAPVVQATRESNYPIGVVPGHVFEEETFQIQAGGGFWLYTDGVIEAMDDQQRLFGVERLKSLLERKKASDTALRDLLTSIQEFTGGAPQSDDLTAVSINAL